MAEILYSVWVLKGLEKRISASAVPVTVCAW